MPKSTPPPPPCTQQKDNPYYVDVIIRTVPMQLTYLVPSDLSVQKGSMLEVPYRNSKAIGFVVSRQNTLPTGAFKLKSVHRCLSQTSPLSEPYQNFLLEVAKQYASNLTETLPLALIKPYWQDPALPFTTVLYTISSGRWLKVLEKTISKLKHLQHNPPHLISQALLVSENFTCKQIQKLQETGWLTPVSPSNLPPQPAPTLSIAQTSIVHSLQDAQEGFCMHYLFGVTGSGKTHIYMSLAHQMIQEKGKQVLLLVPEISLTTQLIERLSRCFSSWQIACLHSGMSEKNRILSWKRAVSNEAKLIVGTRSALFTPLQNLGMIIMDEEHDTSYKEQQGLRYHARVVATILAKTLKIPLVFGSATPSLSCYTLIEKGAIHLHRLQTRYQGTLPPSIHLEPQHGHKRSQSGLERNFKEIEQYLMDGQKVLVYINRRGFSPCLWCHECKTTSFCSGCDLPYTFYESRKQLVCHRCDVSLPTDLTCGKCNTPCIPLGYGTERIAEELRARFPSIAIWQVDRDHLTTHSKLEAMLKELHQSSPMIIVATQLMIKSHHIKDLSLVLFLDADKALYSRDFRSTEHLLQECFQLVGRAGREGDYPAKVLIKTMHPNHPIWKSLMQHSYIEALQSIHSSRKNALLPPYSHQMVIHFQAKNPDRCLQDAQHVFAALGGAKNPNLFPPFESMAFKRQGWYKFALVIQASIRPLLYQYVQEMRTFLSKKQPFSIKSQVLIDFDPMEI